MDALDVFGLLLIVGLPALLIAGFTLSRRIDTIARRVDVLEGGFGPAAFRREETVTAADRRPQTQSWSPPQSQPDPELRPHAQSDLQPNRPVVPSGDEDAMERARALAMAAARTRTAEVVAREAARVEAVRIETARAANESSRQTADTSASVVPARPRVAIDWELFAGGRFFNIAGAIVLIIGVALFMKYAFDNNWIGAPLRVVAGLFAGAAAIVIGSLTHEKHKTQGRAWFAEGVFGAGIGILYVSGYTAFQSYHLVSFAPAFAYMAAVTFASLAIALRFESFAMAVIGYAGGFLTPFGLGMANVDAGSLAAYVVCLDAGLAALVFMRGRWFALQPLALCASYGTAIFWYVTFGANAQPSLLVSSLELLSIWFVFFVSGVAGALREGPSDAPAAVATRTSVEVANAIVFWSSLYLTLVSDATLFAIVQGFVAAGYALAFGSVVRVAATRYALRTRYISGFAAFAIGAIATYAPQAELTLIFGALAIVASGVAALCGVRALRGSREAAFIAFGFLTCASLGALATPGLLLPGEGWTIAFGSRDLALTVLAVATFAVDRLGRAARLGDTPGIVLRQLGVVSIVALEVLDVRGFALPETLVATGIALALVQRVLRRFGASYAPNGEPALASLALFGLGSIALVSSHAALDPAYGSLDLAMGSRDVALLVLGVGAFLADRIWRGETSLKSICPLFRFVASLAALVLETLHMHGLGLATALAITSMLVLALDRTLRAAGSSYATEREVAYSAAGASAAAWVAVAFGCDKLAYAGPGVFAGFGHADSTLAVLIASTIVLVRSAAAALPGWAPTVARQSIVLALALGALKHTTGLAFWATLAVEATAYAYVGTRRMLRDVEISGIAALTVALSGMLLEPAAWQARDLATFALLRDARGATLPSIALCAIVAGEIYRRRSLLSQWVGRTLRLAGVATIVFTLTGEVRDAFEHAATSAKTFDLQALAHIRDVEGLAVSALWIVASIIIIALGTRLRMKDFRIAAIALFDLTILKAFFVDLGSLAAPYRILSFMGLGLTLLAVSYMYQRLERGGAPGGATQPDALAA